GAWRDLQNFLKRQAPPAPCYCVEAWRFGRGAHGQWPPAPSSRGRPSQTTRWLAVSEVERWVRQRHRSPCDALDGAASWPRVRAILEHLGWDFRDLVTKGYEDEMARLIKQGVRRWRRTLPPAAFPEGVQTWCLGGLLLLS